MTALAAARHGTDAPLTKSLKAVVFAPMSSFRPRDGRDATASVACSPPPAPSSCRTSRRKRSRRISCGLAALAFEPRWDRISRFTAEGRMAEVNSALVRSRRRMADSPSDCGWPYQGCRLGVYGPDGLPSRLGRSYVRQAKQIRNVERALVQFRSTAIPSAR